MNNDAQMMVTVWEKLFFNERYTATLNERNADFVSLAVILAVIIVHLQTMSIVQWAVLLLVQELEC